MPGKEGVAGAHGSSAETVDSKADGEAGTRLRDSQDMSCEKGQEASGPHSGHEGCRTPARKGEGGVEEERRRD